LATTDLDLFTPGFVQQAALWRIDAGRLEEVLRPSSEPPAG
jgi:hypothetical protein